MQQLGEFITNHWILSLVFVLILTLIIANEVKRKVLGYKEVTAADAIGLINHDHAVVLDVREENEYGQFHILNAINIPLGNLDKHINTLEKHRSTPVIVYCRAGQQSARASMLLKQNGFQSVYKLKGGVMSWQSANLPLAS